MEKNTLVFFIGILIAGFFIGYIFGNSGFTNSNIHRMPNGTMMENDHEHGASNMDEMMHSMTESLEEKSGAEFDKEFLEQMIIHHEGAVEMASMVLSQSSSAQLKTFAQEIISVQSSEIAMMNNWLKSGISSATPSTPPVLPPDTGITSPSNPGNDGGMVACTMEAMMCPDGETYVGRQGPNCEFAKCPGF